MKTQLDHLPPHKREQIEAIAALIRAAAPVEMIILFGSYARGDHVEDLPNAYFSDYDLMVVVGTQTLADDEALWSDVAERARRIAGRVPVTLLVHEVREINREIRWGQYFYADVVNEGVLLYDSRRFTLATPKALNAQEWLQLGQHNFRYWFESASEFWRGAAYYATRDLRAHAAFLLHQATERYSHAVLLVYGGYKPKTHDIAALAQQTAPLHPALAGAMPRTEPEDKRLFELLKRAYIDARYSKNYRVTESELETLAERVLDLAARTRAACVAKLASFCGPQAVGDLPEVPVSSETVELPEAPPLNDQDALAAWRNAVIEKSYERSERLRQQGLREGHEAGLREGEARGREAGLREGEERGRAQERARSILDVLRRRGVDLTDAEVERILACHDEQRLARLWDLAWTASSAQDLLSH
jgi:predicted nucleotidyltransferase/HEPN domain-containing protein